MFSFNMKKIYTVCLVLGLYSTIISTVSADALDEIKAAANTFLSNLNAKLGGSLNYDANAIYNCNTIDALIPAINNFVTDSTVATINNLDEPTRRLIKKDFSAYDADMQNLIFDHYNGRGVPLTAQMRKVNWPSRLR